MVAGDPGEGGETPRLRTTVLKVAISVIVPEAKWIDLENSEDRGEKGDLHPGITKASHRLRISTLTASAVKVTNIKIIFLSYIDILLL